MTKKAVYSFQKTPNLKQYAYMLHECYTNLTHSVRSMGDSISLEFLLTLLPFMSLVQDLDLT